MEVRQCPILNFWIVHLRGALLTRIIDFSIGTPIEWAGLLYNLM